MIRAGIVGAGLHALVHLEGYGRGRNVSLEAVCDVVPGRAAEIASKYGIPNVCANMEEMLSRGLVDIVDIITPPLTHLQIVGEALAAGVHVICEKPLALDVEEAKAMCRLAGQAQGSNFTAFQRRYDPVLIHVRKLIRDGFIGELVLSNASVMVNWGVLKHESQAAGYRQWLDSVATGGGFVSGALPHYADLVRYLLGEVTSQISLTDTAPTFSQGASSNGDRPDDTVVLAGTIAGGGVFNIAATWSAGNPTQERWEIVGSQRTLIVQPDGTLLATTASGMEELAVPWSSETGREGYINGGFGFGNAGPGFGAMITDVAQSLMHGSEPHCAKFVDGLRSAEIIAELQANRRIGSAQ